jgi:DNA-binding NtrC family response regulator
VDVESVDRGPADGSQFWLDLPGLEGEAFLDLVLDPCTVDVTRLLDFFRQVAIVVAPVVRAERMAGLGLPGVAKRPPGTKPILGTSDAMQGLRAQIQKVARTDFSVLIEGESGVGKELVARQVHESSRRRRGPFVPINCAALVETLVEAELFGIEDRTATGVRGRRGRFEQADGGTLFLDEIGDLALAAQAKLLRVLQEWSVERVGGQASQRVDVRVIAATNRSLSQLVDEGRFRFDLYHRLNCLEVRVPPLRTRRDDIPELAMAALARHRQFGATRVSLAAMDALKNYSWPGNVRELERAIERAVAFAEDDVIQVEDLPPHVARTYAEILLPAADANETLRAWGSRYARLVLGRCQNNKRQACRTLGITYHTLQAYLSYRPFESQLSEPSRNGHRVHGR